MGIVMMNPPAVVEPAVVEAFGVTELYADGGFFRDRGDIMTGIYWVEVPACDQIERHVICRIHFSRARWFAALDLTLQRLRGAVH